MRTVAFIASCLPLVAGLSCGSAGSTAPPPADTSTVESFRTLALEVQSSLMTYGDTMVSAPTQDTCRAAHDRYNSQVRPWVEQMATTSKGMDAFMETHAGDMVTDVSCAVAAMTDELDRHDVAACSSTDASANRAEVDRHVGAMVATDAHLLDRCQTMMQAGATPLKWSPMMQSCLSWTGP